jgi:hypothetical protein
MTWKQPAPVNQINFGKYKGKTFEEVYGIDPDYIRWMRDTTDPADAKNEGKYAKQNQARIKYLDNLLTEGVSTQVATPLPKPVQAVSAPKQFVVNPSTFETILKILMSLEEKVDALMKTTKADTIIRPSEMKPDEECPFGEDENTI